MNAKKYVMAGIVLNVVLLAFAASLWQTQRPDNKPSLTALSGPSGEFGPTIEAVLPTSRTEANTDKLDIMDLETGRALLQPPLEEFDSRADAVMAWIRSNRLDISCSVWPNGAACVTYNMTVVGGDRTCWDGATEEALLAEPALASGLHSPRRLLVLGHGRPDTYMFRTGEGTLGMLQILGLSRDGRGVKIRYKLINPASPENAVALR